MTGTTAKYAIPYATGTDPLGAVAARMQSLAERVDLLNGETGQLTIVPSAINTTTSVRVNYVRTYAALAAIPRAFVVNNAVVQSTDSVYLWVSLEDATGFTLNVRASSVTGRNVRWFCRGVS